MVVGYLVLQSILNFVHFWQNISTISRIPVTSKSYFDYLNDCDQYSKKHCKFLIQLLFCDRELKTNVSIGDIFAVETVENLYHRVQVLEILEKDMRGNPQLVLVQFLDEGKQQSFQVWEHTLLSKNVKVMTERCI